METGKSVARLRFVRDLLGRTASEGEGDAEGGFTLIELMVVLLIMGILLAIAIPTFLSVTGGAKKTAAQSNLTDAITSATAVYTNDDHFPSSTNMATALAGTQNSITFFPVTATGTTEVLSPGKNDISVYTGTTTTNDLVILSSLDSAKVCWVAVLNEGAAISGGIPKGNHFYGVTGSSATACKASAFEGTVVSTTEWKDNFSTFSTTIKT